MKQPVTRTLTQEQIKMAKERSTELEISESEYIGWLIERDYNNVSIKKVGESWTAEEILKREG